ncbi:MAG: glutamine--fructose-6-phosphate transaminase (isomerizing) [Candidatus Micrarchaeota archaeon]|nr:glutamine--fructose-6-phosphate transaminase (isomerizing) [Candidatus Micrarchaeota archaeon]
MCGIVGYIGNKNALEIVLEGLKKVEYRGYDSAGIAYEANNEIKIVKDVGTISKVFENNKTKIRITHATKAIGHTRWATHGPPCKQNAHPHLDCSKKIAIVHNGIIENYLELKKQLSDHKIESETDSEIIAHLIEQEMKKEKDTEKAIINAIKKLEGTYAIGIMLLDENSLYLAKKYAPLIIGIGKEEMFFASDIPAILKYSKEIIVMEDGDFAKITPNKVILYNKDLVKIEPKILKIDWTESMAKKEGFEHFMLKEIFEQKIIVKNSISVDVSAALNLIKKAKNLAIIGCGTSYYSALAFCYLMHKYKIPIFSYIASEYNEWSVKNEDLIIAISQSGETADTLKVVRQAKEQGSKIVAITNVIGSSLALNSDATINIGAGPEISVVATKSFIAQLIVLYKLAYLIGGEKEKLNRLGQISEKIERVLKKDQEIKNLAKKLKKHKDFLFLSKGLGYVCALEGALKLKEITYLHAEAYAAGELKHGPISMIEKNMPVIFIAPKYLGSTKIINNIKECKARGATIIALSDDKEILDEADIKIEMEEEDSELFLIYYIVPLQLLAYYLAVELKKDPDKPRNLAKSVTVE